MMKKIICHIDVNSAYLSWTALQQLAADSQVDLRQIHSVISGNRDSRHGVVLAKSIPAKARGIITGEPLAQALRKCPGLHIARPDFDLYQDYSQKFMAILQEMAPVVEQFSIDEAWIDISGMRRLYGSPLQAANLIKDRIRDQLGFSVNIGVSSNKLLSKMASDFSKPDRVHALFPQEISVKMWPLPVRRLFSVGPATERKLHDVGIITIGDLAQADPQYLKLRLQNQAYTLCDFANGRAESELSPQSRVNKCYSNSQTTEKDIVDAADAHRLLLALSETVGMRMRLDGQSGSCLAVQIRNTRFVDSSRQKQLPQPTNHTSDIYYQACGLFDQLWDGHSALRLLGISMSKISAEHPQQYTLFSTDDHHKQNQLDHTVDKIRAKFGEDSIQRASLIDAGQDYLIGRLRKKRHQQD